MSTAPREAVGPAEGNDWPAQLTARVITPGPRPHVHGYDIEGDVAAHYRFGESILLALTGEAPEAAIGRCFEVGMTFLSPLAVTEAPTHAAVLARTCAGSVSAVTGTAAIGLAEQARSLLARFGPLLAWLDEGCAGAPPEIARACDDDDRRSVARLRAALGELSDRLPDHELGREAAVIALLHRCGLRTSEQIEVAFVVARLSTTVAEALASKRGALREYPLNLPPFAYEEGPR